MDLKLADKIAVVTGAGKGIGFAVTQALVEEARASRTTDTLDGQDGVVAVAVDLAAPDGPALLVQRALEEHGRVDVLVNTSVPCASAWTGFSAPATMSSTGRCR